MKTYRKFKCDCGTDPITGRDGYCDKCNDTGFVFEINKKGSKQWELEN